MRTSLIICTKDRPDDLRRTLDSVRQQTRLPNEVIIVDAGSLGSLDVVMSRDTADTLHARYFQTPPVGTNYQRNIAVRESTGDVLLLIDDDVTLSPHYLENVVAVFTQDTTGTVGAVGGRAFNEKNDQDATGLRRMLLPVIHGIRRFAFLPVPSSNGRMLPSGLANYPDLSEEQQSIEALYGCCMSFRRDVFTKVQFEEKFHGYCYLDDLDIARELRRAGYEILYAPTATLTHHQSPNNRLEKDDLYRMWVVNFYYILAKDRTRTLWNKYATTCAVLGLLLLCLGAFSPVRLRGLLSGLWLVMAGRNPLLR